MATYAAVYRAEGRDNNVFVCTVRWLCDWDALEIKGKRNGYITRASGSAIEGDDPSRAHQEIAASFRIPGGGEIFPFRNYPLTTLRPPYPPPPLRMHGLV